MKTKRIISIALAVVMSLALMLPTFAKGENYDWNIYDCEFSDAADLDIDTNVNLGTVQDGFQVYQTYKSAFSYEKEGDNGFVRMVGPELGDAQMEHTFLTAANGYNVSDKTKANVSLAMSVRFRQPKGSVGIHFRFGSSSLKTVVDTFVNGSGNLCIETSANVIAKGVNDGEWHTFTMVAKYNSNEDSISCIFDGKETFSGKFSDNLRRTDTPIMTALILMEKKKGTADIDYVKVSDGARIYNKDYLKTAPTVEEDGKYNQNSYIIDKDGKKETISSAVFESDKDVSFKAWYLRTMVQYKEEEGGMNIRFVSMLDENLADYCEAGFIVNDGTEDTKLKTTVANTSFIADGNTVSIGDYSQDDDYFFLANTSFDSAVVSADPQITVTPYVTLIDGETTITGNPVTFKLSDLK